MEDWTQDTGQPSTISSGWVTATEAATQCRVHHRNIRRAIERGDLPATKRSGIYRIDPVELRAWQVSRRGGNRWQPLVIHAGVKPQSRPNLPRPITPFIGREGHIAQVASLLLREDVRLLTLTGPGGVGKTRLAIRVAAEVAAEFPDGLWFVALAPISDPALVAAAVAQALGVPGTGTRTIEESLRAFIGERRALIILDNFEHVLDAGSLVTAILSTCSNLTIFVTSRTVLRVSGEHSFEVPPLPLPPAGSSSRTDHQLASEAVQLFVERAGAARSDFSATANNLPTIVAICAKLEGLPLAIELAAARLVSLSPAALLSLLERRMTLLTGGPRDQPSRLRSMRDAIAWSYDLLAPNEKRLLRRLSVFVGGFTLPAAEAVAGGGADVLDSVTSLVASSLVQRDGHGDSALDAVPRFGMLETIREYGLELLVESGEEHQTRGQHAAYFEAAVEQLTPTPRMPASEARLSWIGNERGNLRAVLDWLDKEGEIERLLLMATRLWPLWSILGFSEGRRILELGLKHGDTVPVFLRGMAMTHAATLVDSLGEAERGLLMLDEGLALARTVDNSTRENRADIGLILRQRGRILLGLGRYLEAAQSFEESLTAFRELGSEPNIAFSLCHVGVAAYGQGDLKLSRAHCEAALALARTSGSTMFIVLVLEYLGLVAFACGDITGAARAFSEAFVQAEKLGANTGHRHRLAGVAVLAVGCGSPEEAARLLGAAGAETRTWGTPFQLPMSADYDRATAEARAMIGEDRFATAWATGQALTREEAVADAREFLAKVESNLVATVPVGPVVVRNPQGLTTREMEVLQLLTLRYTNPEIADHLCVSTRTIQTHVSHILQKLGVRSRREAAASAERLGLS